MDIPTIVERVTNSHSATVYVSKEEAGELTDDDIKTLNVEHGILAVEDVVRDAWAFSRGVPEEVLQTHEAEEAAPAEAAAAPVGIS